MIVKKEVIIAIIVVAVLFIGGGSFYGGMQYAQSQGPRLLSQNGFLNLSAEEMQQRLGQMGAAGNLNGGGRGGQGGGFVSGEVISKDDQSITVKTIDGSSKIVFYSDSTEVNKIAESNKNSLIVGSSVTANGTSNQDGSVTAQSIQVR